jgi:hypothetical protein
MAYNGSGVFSLVAGNPVITGTTISSTWANNTLSDIANNGLTNCLTKDGQTTPTANLTMGNFRLTSLAAAIARTDALNAGQIQDAALVQLSGVSGADTIVASTSPAITVYTQGASFLLFPASNNATTTPTLNLNGLGAKNVLRGDGGSLGVGSLVANVPYVVTYDGTSFRLGGVLNAIIPGATATSDGSLTLTGVVNAQTGNRNYFVDGGITQWNLATATSSVSGTVTPATMYYNGAGTTGVVTVSQNSFAVGGAPAGMTTPQALYMKHNQTTGGTNNPFIAQHIESVSTLQGRSATFSCWLWVDSGTLNITQLGTGQNFGTGGSPSSTVNTNFTVNWTVTTTPQRFSALIPVPSISGKTLGSNNNDTLSVSINLPISTTFALNTTQWQIESCNSSASSSQTGNGGSPTPFEFRGAQVEAARVSRYYQIVSPAKYWAYMNAASQVFGNTVYFSPMRAAPAVSFAGQSLANLSGLTIEGTGISSSKIFATASAGGAVVLDLGIVTLDARL